MKLKYFLISLLVVGSTAVVADEIQVAQVTFKDQMINQTNTFVERTVNIIATPFLSDRDVDCLARNIFYEAGSESTEGKVAVGMVTINRAQDPRYPQNVCGVVRQKTVATVPQRTTTVKTVKEDFLSPPKQVVETQTAWVQKVVCQFSWTCSQVPAPKAADPRWIESKQVAETIARGGYPDYQVKYGQAMHFHAVYVKPGWKLKRVAQTGNHIFYE
jgi:spore germination cell wall hydrolase CwlJ-like protein